MKKKYIIAIVVVILILSIFIIILFSGYRSVKNQNNNIQTPERSSQDYKITEDFVLVNIPQDDISEAKATTTNNMIDPNLIFKSSGFNDQERIPKKYTCDGENINPGFDISGVNSDAKSLVIVVDDPDAQAGVWVHWIKFNIPVGVTEILEGQEPEGISGKGTGENLEYFGPCPPDLEHSYSFRLYSLDIELTLPEGSGEGEVLEVMEGHILQTAELVGKYERIKE
jgi:Raf kinase inhibitor-like YbhB/YbcL family protein